MSLFTHPWRAVAIASLCGLAVAPLVALPAAAAPDGTGVVINEAYISGGSRNAAFLNKFVELYNPTNAEKSLAGLSLQYRPAKNGDKPFGTVIALSGSIPAGGHYLISGGSNDTNGAELPTPDLKSTLSPAAAGGVIALVNGTAALPANTLAGEPGAPVPDPAVVDLLGYGTADTFEGAPAAYTSPNTEPRSLNRTGGVDTDHNGNDFKVLEAITPTNAKGETSAPATTPTPPVIPPVEPGDIVPATIAEIQGTGTESPLVGKTVTTTGFVTAVYATGGYNGFYLQTAGTGGAVNLDTHNASDAIFIYSPKAVGSVAVGDYVEVGGPVAEYFGMTQITSDVAKKLDATGLTAPLPAAVPFPADEAQREALEGMLLAPTGAFTVTETYTTNQYGDIGLAASGSPLVNPTVLGPVGSAEYKAAQKRIQAEAVRLDDGASTNFLGATNKAIPVSYLSNDNPVRVGAAVDFTAPVILDYRNDAWRFQPTAPVSGSQNAPATFENTRTEAPRPVGGDVKLATFNVLNYFPTTGESRNGCTFYTDRDGNKITVNKSDAPGCGVRGAATAQSLERQQAKIIAAINALDADVVSLEEIENSAKLGQDRDAALKTLVAALNRASGSERWAAVTSPSERPDAKDEDVIRTGFIYNPAVVKPAGEGKILKGSDAFKNAREPDAQPFTTKNGGDAEKFLVISNHFKSKGSAGATGDNVDLKNGVGGFNGDRTRQAQALVAFADSMKKQVKTEKVFLVGDFNSYDAEDPILVLTSAGYISQEAKTGKFTYAYDGAVGSLDHVFASPAADAAVVGADVWNINSVESVGLEYSRYNNNVTDLYRADAFRSSDHDPVIVGFNAGGSAPATATVNLLNINDFHGRINPNTVKFAGTVEGLKAGLRPDQSALLSAGDNIGASEFASSSQLDQPAIDVLNALNLRASAVGNHEFDQGMSDLTDRVIDGGKNARWAYLGANVYRKGTTTPALPEYEILEMDGLKVAVIGAITEETGTLVSPNGIADLEFGDPVEAVNRVAAALTDGDPANGEADIIVAEYHEGAGAGAPDGATLADELKIPGAFTRIVTETSPAVDAIFTGHTHKEYAWDAPVPGVAGKTRPVLQTGSYGERIGQITLTVERATGTVSAYTARNVPRVSTADADLIAQFPAVAEVKTIVADALAKADELGNKKVSEASADITRAFNNGVKDDRSAESTLGGLVADSLLDSLRDPRLGGAEIGVVNPGGMREELPKGDVSFADANAVLPFLNNLWTTTLTGAQFKTILEQQWQLDKDGKVPSRPYLQLGLSKNVSYTFDAERKQGDRITSISVNGAPIDAEREYRIGSFSFLLTGGDNFWEFKNGKDTRDSGLIDRDAWVSYLGAHAPVGPDFARRSVQVQGVPTAAVAPGETVTLSVSKLDLTSKGSPLNTTLGIELGGVPLGTATVAEGASRVTFQVPADAAAGATSLVLTAMESKTVVRVPLTIGVASGVTPAAPEALTADLRDLVSVTGTVTPGATVTVSGDVLREKSVSAWLYSTPAALTAGVVPAGAEGRISVLIPADIALGAHRLSVQDEAGNVLGWTAVTVLAAETGTPGAETPGTPGVTQPGTGGNAGALPGTGTTVPWAVGGIAFLLLAAGATVFLLRRREAGAEAA